MSPDTVSRPSRRFPPPPPQKKRKSTKEKKNALNARPHHINSPLQRPDGHTAPAAATPPCSAGWGSCSTRACVRRRSRTGFLCLSRPGGWMRCGGGGGRARPLTSGSTCSAVTRSYRPNSRRHLRVSSKRWMAVFACHLVARRYLTCHP